MYFHVYRDCFKFGLRKVIVELYEEGNVLVDRSRMFAGIRFEQRLKRRKEKMLKRALIILG